MMSCGDEMETDSHEVNVGRSGPNLEPGTMRVYVTNGPRNGLDIGRKVGPCPGSRRRWVLGSVDACSQAVNTVPGFRLGRDLPNVRSEGKGMG